MNDARHNELLEVVIAASPEELVALIAMAAEELSERPSIDPARTT